MNRAIENETITIQVGEALLQLDPLWDFPVERIDVAFDGINVRLRVDGLSGLARELADSGRKAAA
jgi:hypothetical protein